MMSFKTVLVIDKWKNFHSSVETHPLHSECYNFAKALFWTNNVIFHVSVLHRAGISKKRTAKRCLQRSIFHYKQFHSRV